MKLENLISGRVVSSFNKNSIKALVKATLKVLKKIEGASDIRLEWIETCQRVDLEEISFDYEILGKVRGRFNFHALSGYCIFPMANDAQTLGDLRVSLYNDNEYIFVFSEKNIDHIPAEFVIHVRQAWNTKRDLML